MVLKLNSTTSWKVANINYITNYGSTAKNVWDNIFNLEEP
jgi:hypothetical protein